MALSSRDKINVKSATHGTRSYHLTWFLDLRHNTQNNERTLSSSASTTVELHVNACWLVLLKVVHNSDWYITYLLANCFWSAVTPLELFDFSSMCFFQGIIVCLEFRRDEVKLLCSSCTFYYQTFNVKQMFKNTGMCDIGVLTYYRINIINGTNVMPVFFFPGERTLMEMCFLLIFLSLSKPSLNFWLLNLCSEPQDTNTNTNTKFLSHCS